MDGMTIQEAELQVADLEQRARRLIDAPSWKVDADLLLCKLILELLKASKRDA